MATPARLIEFRCPRCSQTHWDMDSDARGTTLMRVPEKPYSERTYSCPSCSYSGMQFSIVQASPPEFILQPHRMYPMTTKEFDYWAGTLRTHFPDHPKAARLGTSFVPYPPEQAAEDRRHYEEQHPIALMRDQEGARRTDPSYRDAEEWLDMLDVGDTLEFQDRQEQRLVVRRQPDTTFDVGRSVGDEVNWGSRRVSRDQALRTIRTCFAVPQPRRRRRLWERW